MSSNFLHLQDAHTTLLRWVLLLQHLALLRAAQNKLLLQAEIEEPVLTILSFSSMSQKLIECPGISSLITLAVSVVRVCCTSPCKQPIFSCERGQAWLGMTAVTQRLFCLLVASRAAWLGSLKVKPSESKVPAALAVTAARPAGGPGYTQGNSSGALPQHSCNVECRENLAWKPNLTQIIHQ